MERTKRVLVLGEAKVGKTWLLAQLFSDMNDQKRQAEQLNFQLLDQTVMNQDAQGENVHPAFGEGEKALKSLQGCQIHAHLLNQHYTMERSNSTFYFAEFHELSGSIGLNPTMLQVYTY